MNRPNSNISGGNYMSPLHDYSKMGPSEAGRVTPFDYSQSYVAPSNMDWDQPTSGGSSEVHTNGVKQERIFQEKATDVLEL